MRRPPSYSDSFLVLGSQESLEPLILIPDSPAVDRIGTSLEPFPPLVPLAALEAVPENPWPKRISLFVIKSSIHVFLISVFETIFFFSYVSVTENTGIVKTIDTYYEPIRDSCPSWGNLTKMVLYDLLEDVNVSRVDSEAAAALSQRENYNHGLFKDSLAVSGVCLAIFLAFAGLMRLRKMKIPWAGVVIENLMMVSLLGIYEYFFFRVIIYNYDTLSTPELNAHIVDGLWACVSKA
jgi:hypothetical protein